MAEPKPFLSLIIPAYNEAKRIAETVEIVRAYLGSLGEPYEIIVVDDGCTDATREILSGIPDIEVISYHPNRGKGHAVRQGMLASKGDYAAFTDVDLSAPIDELAKLFAAVHAGADVAIGSRAMGGSQLLVRQPRYRELGGKMLNLAIQLLAVPGIHDTQCGLKLFAGDLARRVFAQCVLNGWGFDVEALYLARRLGGRIAEVPVRWSHDADTRIRPLRAGLQVIRDTIRIRLHKYRDLRSHPRNSHRPRLPMPVEQADRGGRQSASARRCYVPLELAYRCHHPGRHTRLEERTMRRLIIVPCLLAIIPALIGCGGGGGSTGAGVGAGGVLGGPEPGGQYGQIPTSVFPCMSPDPAAVAPRLSLIVTDEGRIGIVRAARAANPNLRFFLYEIVGATYENLPFRNDPIGYDWLIQHHPEWLLLDQAGQTIHFENYPQLVALDVGNPEYQHVWTENAIAIAKSLGAEAISIDNMNSRYDWAYGAGVIPAKYPDRASYIQALDSFVRYAVQEIHAAGLLVIGNGGGESSNSGMWAQWNGLFDGRQYEPVPLFGDGTPQDVDARWLDFFNGFQTFSDKINVVYMPRKPMSEQNFRYFVAEYLMWAGPQTYMGLYCKANESVPSDPLQDIHIGNPIELGHCVAGTVYQREYRERAGHSQLLAISLGQCGRTARPQERPGCSRAVGIQGSRTARQSHTSQAVILLRLCLLGSPSRRGPSGSVAGGASAFGPIAPGNSPPCLRLRPWPQYPRPSAPRRRTRPRTARARDTPRAAASR